MGFCPWVAVKSLKPRQICVCLIKNSFRFGFVCEWVCECLKNFISSLENEVAFFIVAMWIVMMACFLFLILSWRMTSMLTPLSCRERQRANTCGNVVWSIMPSLGIPQEYLCFKFSFSFFIRWCFTFFFSWAYVDMPSSVVICFSRVRALCLTNHVPSVHHVQNH